MRLQTKARDCLYLNWALPRELLPPPPPPLRYEVHRWNDADFVFASALLFRFDGLHPPALPFLRVSYPQMNLRLYVEDDDSLPAVLFVRMMVPFWVVPLSRILGRQPAQAGRFDYPPLTSGLGDPDDFAGEEPPAVDDLRWSLRGGPWRGGRLEVRGRLASPRLGEGPDLGGWRRTVDYVRRRPVGYVSWDGRLRSLRKSHPSVPVWPLDVEVGACDLLEGTFRGVGTDTWCAPHSAWLCPEIPFHFEIGRPELLPSLARPRNRTVAVPDGV